MFYVAIQATDNVQNFKNHILKFHFSTVLDIFLILVQGHTELRKSVQKVTTLIREVLPRPKSVSAGAKPLGSVLLFLDRFSQVEWCQTEIKKDFQKHLEISFLDMFLKIMNIVCSLNGLGKCLETFFQPGGGGCLGLYMGLKACEDNNTLGIFIY